MTKAGTGRRGRKRRPRGRTIPTTKCTVRFSDPVLEQVEAAAEAMDISRDYYLELLMSWADKQGLPTSWDEIVAADQSEHQPDQDERDQLELPLQTV